MPRNIDIERPLGFLEWVFWLLEQLGSMNIVVAAEVCGPLTPEVLRRSLDLVQSHHPLLQVHVAQGPRNRFWFVSDNVESIPLRVLDAPRESWVEEAERERAEPFAQDAGPLCRCVLLRHGDHQASLLTTINHVIGDGISALFLVRLILQVAGALCDGRQPILERQPPSVALDDRLPRWTVGAAGVGKSLRNRIHETFRRWNLGPAEPLPADSEAPMHQRRSRLIPLELDPDQTRRVLRQIRPTFASLHGVLAAAQLRSIAQELSDRESITLSILTGTSLRPRLEPPSANGDLGLFAAAVQCAFRVDRRDALWNLADEISDAVGKKINSGADMLAVAKWPATLAALRWWVSPTQQGMQRFTRILSRRPPTTMISVVPRGEQVTRASDYGPLSIESVQGFAAGPRTPLFSMGSVSNGRLHWNFIYLEPILKRERAQRIAKRAMDDLCQSVSQRKPADAVC